MYLIFCFLCNANFRTSIIEIGAVSTPLKKNAEENVKEAGISLNWDNTTLVLFKEYAAKVLLPAMNISRHPREIGQLIEKVILSNEPHLRYQSDEHQLNLLPPCWLIRRGIP